MTNSGTEPPLHIVLFEPEIPPNTGNIARLCACTGCQLHLVHPLGFEISDRQLKRAGLDYWPFLKVQEHANWNALRQSLQTGGSWYGLSSKASRSIWETEFDVGDVLVLGPETRGLPQQVQLDINISAASDRVFKTNPTVSHGLPCYPEQPTAPEHTF